MQDLQDQQAPQSEQIRELRRLRRVEQQRKRKLHIRIVAGVVLVILVLSAILIVRGLKRKNAQELQPETPAQPEQTEQVKLPVLLPTESDTVIHVAAVGDIMISDELLADALQANGSYDFSGSFTAVSGMIAAADLAIGNLELNFCGEPYEGKPTYRAPESLALCLSTMGFDVLQTANSCSIANGLAGLKSTIDYLGLAGIDHVGTYASEAARNESGGVLIRTVNGIRIAILGYTKGLAGLQLPEGTEYAVDLLYSDYASDFTKINQDAIVRSVEAAKAQNPDVILAMLHWGSEADRSVTKSQEKIATLLFENGVDAIVGSHSHMAGPMKKLSVTTVDGTVKDCFIAYSLGNFFSSMGENAARTCQESLILDLEFTKSSETGDTSLSNVTYTPLYLADEGETKTPRYEILPIRSAINSGLFPELKQTMTDAIAHLRTNTDSDFDSGK